MRRVTDGVRDRRARQGETLRRLRVERGLELVEAAAATDSPHLDRSRIWRLEHGSRPIGYEDLAALSRAYGIPLEELQKEVGDQQAGMFWDMVATLRADLTTVPTLTDEEAGLLAAVLQAVRLSQLAL